MAKRTVSGGDGSSHALTRRPTSMPVDSAITVCEMIVELVEDVLDEGDLDERSRSSLSRLCRVVNRLCAELG